MIVNNCTVRQGNSPVPVSQMLGNVNSFFLFLFFSEKKKKREKAGSRRNTASCYIRAIVIISRGMRCF